MDSDKAYDVIQAIKQTRKRTEKQEILRANPFLQIYLQYTYDPFRRYGFGKIPPVVNRVGEAVGQINSAGWEILDQIAERQITGTNVKEVVTNYMSHLSLKSAMVFSGILMKDFKMGLQAKTINQVFPGLIPTHPIMRAKLFKDHKHRIVYPAVSTVKKDGLRGVYENGTMLSRRGHTLIGLQHLVDALSPYFLKADGELDIAGVSHYKASGLIRDHEQSPFVRFGIIELPNADGDLIARLAMADRIVEQIGSDKVYTIPYRIINSEEEAYQHYRECRADGDEGTVVKNIDYRYQDTRSFDWQKLKNVESLDLPVVGKYEGEGRLEGTLGGLVCTYNGQKIRVGSGFTDDERYKYWGELPDRIEVEFHEYTPDGMLREPRHVRERWDK